MLIPVSVAQVILCDLCDRGFHLFCIGLDCVPHGEFRNCVCFVVAVCYLYYQDIRNSLFQKSVSHPVCVYETSVLFWAWARHIFLCLFGAAWCCVQVP